MHASEVQEKALDLPVVLILIDIHADIYSNSKMNDAGVFFLVMQMLAMRFVASTFPDMYVMLRRSKLLCSKVTNCF
jgi:hypothetical protein